MLLVIIVVTTNLKVKSQDMLLVIEVITNLAIKFKNKMYGIYYWNKYPNKSRCVVTLCSSSDRQPHRKTLS